MMTPKKYKQARLARGSVVQVAKLLGVHIETIYKRQRGEPGCPITREAALAMLQLPVRKDGKT